MYAARVKYLAITWLLVIDLELACVKLVEDMTMYFLYLFNV